MGGLMPQRYAVDGSGRRVAFVRELATMDGYRVSLFPDGDHNHSIEGRVPNDEDFAIKMATRWLECDLLRRSRGLRGEALRGRSPA